VEVLTPPSRKKGKLPASMALGGNVKRVLATAIAATMIAAVPAVADPVKDGFLSIRGPDTLQPSATLRVPLRCSVECTTSARTTLKLVGDDVPPSIAKGHLEAGDSKNLIVELNQNAIDEITAQPDGSRLRVSVYAKSTATGKRAKALKVFDFTAPAP
jgi:hypothetical protein